MAPSALTTTPLQLYPLLLLRLQTSQPNVLVSHPTLLHQSQQNTTPTNLTAIAGFTDGTSPTLEQTAKEFSNPTIIRASTPLHLQVPTPPATRTWNLHTNPGGFEMTWKTTHRVFHHQILPTTLPHHRGCWSCNTLTLLLSTPLLLAESRGRTKPKFLLRHLRGWNLNYSQTTQHHHPVLQSILSSERHSIGLHYHPPHGPPTMSPPPVAQPLLYPPLVLPSPTRPPPTARPVSLPASTNYTKNSD